MECSFRSNEDTSVFVRHSFKENEDAHVYHLHKDNVEIQDICVTFTQRKVGQFHSGNDTKRCASPHNINIMCKIKGNKKVCSFRKSIVWQSHKIQWDSSTGKLKDMYGSPLMEKECEVDPEEKNMVQAVYSIFDSHKQKQVE